MDVGGVGYTIGAILSVQITDYRAPEPGELYIDHTGRIQRYEMGDWVKFPNYPRFYPILRENWRLNDP